VSGRHALVTTLGDNVFVDDLGSTNGTLLNGSRVTKSMLKHGDIIQVGNYQFSYYADDVDDYEPTMFIKAEIEDTRVIDTRTAEDESARGSRLGAVLELRKPFNTLGFNGVKMAVIARENDGYSISGLQSSKLLKLARRPALHDVVDDPLHAQRLCLEILRQRVATVDHQIHVQRVQPQFPGLALYQCDAAGQIG